MCQCICPPANSVLDVAHPEALILFGGSMEFIHLWRGGVTDEEHASLMIRYIPHYQVLKRQHWRLVLGHTAEKGLEKLADREK